MPILLRTFEDHDESAVVALWHEVGLTRPWNDPHADIARARAVWPDLFVVGTLDGAIVGTAMGGYDGHRGAVYYLAVRPSERDTGAGRALMDEVERRLTALGCPKLNVMVRTTNERVLGFYERIGYVHDAVVVRSKRLIVDGPRDP